MYKKIFKQSLKKMISSIKDAVFPRSLTYVSFVLRFCVKYFKMYSCSCSWKPIINKLHCKIRHSGCCPKYIKPLQIKAIIIYIAWSYEVTVKYKITFWITLFKMIFLYSSEIFRKIQAKTLKPNLNFRQRLRKQ